ncbi:MAG: beta-propeller domain-containing protein [Clostridiales bacterium]|nr:beta-propeller domain-containing protein [Clostridiales bacterium]
MNDDKNQAANNVAKQDKELAAGSGESMQKNIDRSMSKNMDNNKNSNIDKNNDKSSDSTEKDFLREIKEDAQQITPPESLSPEAVEQMLRKTQQTGRRGISRLALRLGSLAAVFVLAFAVVGLTGRISRNSSLQSGGTAQTETDGIVTVLLDEDENIIDGGYAGAAASGGASDNASVSENVNVSEDASADEAVGTDGDAVVNENADTDAVAVANENADTDAVAVVNEDDGTDESELTAEDTFTYASSYEEIYDALYEISYRNSVARALGGIMMIDGDMMIEDAEVTDGSASTSGSSDSGSVSGDASANSSTASSEAYFSSDASAAATDSADSATGEDIVEEAEIDYAAEDDDTDAAVSGDGADYSTTNVQEYGVDEGDVVKTDGSYIYILRADGEFLIVSVDSENENNGETALVSRTSLESGNELTVKEMYVDGDVLSIITREYVTSLVENEDGTYYTTSANLTVLYTYDISDREEPVLAGTVTQSGYYSDSRKAGNYIYLFSTWYPSVGDTLDDSTISPLLNGKKADAGSYYLPETLTSTECLVISSVDVTAPSAFVDNKVLVSGGDDFYVSQENIYIVNENYEHSNTVTEITKFHYEDGKITGIAAGSVTGYLNDSFSLNEYDGNLRVVTTYYGDNLSPTANVTDWTEHNALYILSESMTQLSVLSDLAEGETVRSARFLGDTGYFVTFRQTDPLFSVDLSDPENPQVLGELKISGFSSYLHFYGDGLLLGLGYEADEDTGTTTGLKLSMFDISDPSNVTEVAKYVIDGITWCSSLNNYKSILADAGKNLIGFYCEDRYFLFSYDEEEGFVQEMIYDFYADRLSGEADSDTMRGLYISDTLYLAGSSFVISFDMDDSFTKTQVLTME